MQFIHNDLGQRKAGEIVEITLTSGANVRLMNSSDFNSYKNRRRHRYIGGLAKQSPIRLQTPNSGHWHVAVRRDIPLPLSGIQLSDRAGSAAIYYFHAALCHPD